MVIDIEVSSSAPSPTVDPSVHTILIGHSMGGIVAADTLISITSEAPIPPPQSTMANNRTTTPSSFGELPPSPNAFMFPHIQGVLAFDTPYLGIAPSVVAHGAETHYKTATSAYSALSEVAGVFGFGAATSPKQNPPHAATQKQLVPGPESAKDALAATMTASNTGDSAAVPAWNRWGKYAMFAGAAGAVAAGGAAAYLKRDSITEGWTWVGSHLEFVGCLMRGEELKSRLSRVISLRSERDIGFADLVTVLGKGAQKQAPGKSVAGGFVEIGGAEDKGKRMFCTIPAKKRWGTFFEGMVNEKAGDEAAAHMSMFYPKENPGYYSMCERAKELIVGWVDKGWYNASEEGEVPQGEGGADTMVDEEAEDVTGSEEEVEGQVRGGEIKMVEDNHDGDDKEMTSQQHDQHGKDVEPNPWDAETVLVD